MARKWLEGVAGLRRKTLTQPFTKSTGKRADELIRASLNIEMQTSDNHRIINGALETEKVPVLPLRIRYYQSLISTDMLLRYAVLAVAQILCNFHLHFRPVSAGFAHVSVQLPVQGKSFFGNGRSDGKYFSECNGSR